MNKDLKNYIIEKTKVREAVPDDLQQILQLYLHLHETEIPDNNDHLKSVWNKIMNDENYHIIVCEKEEKIVSSVTCIVVPNLTRNVRPYAFIENVVTDKAFRGKGFASDCMKFAEKIAKENNCYKMMLLTGSKDASVHNFYKNAGYNSFDKTAYIKHL